jgi:hypothetical protein
MPIYKSNSILSEISVFFKKNDSNSALFTLTDMLKDFNMLEKIFFERKSKCNSKYSLLQVLQLLIMFPCFMIKNPYNYCRSSLSGFFGCEKDVFYRFVNNEAFDWRKNLYHFTLQGVYFTPIVYQYFNPKVYHFNLISKSVSLLGAVPPPTGKRAFLF